jgi:hypothetical protein
MEISCSHKRRVEEQFDYFCKLVVVNEMKDIRQHEAYLLDQTNFEENQEEEENEILFADFLLSWLKMMKNNLEATSYAAYSVMLKSRIVPYFKPKKIKLKELTPKQIQDYYDYELNEKGLSANTIIHRHAIIRKALQHVLKLDLIDYNPADRTERPRKIRFVKRL